MSPSDSAALKDVIARIEKRYHALLAELADLPDLYEQHLRSGDTDAAEAFAVRLEHFGEELARGKELLARLFATAMELTMERVRQEDRDT